MGPLPPVSPLPSCQNVSFGGIIPYITQKNFWGKNYPFLTIYNKLKIMKHILNNLSEEEKNSIREQHTGGMKVMTESFSKLVNSKLGDSKPLVSDKK
jgi:hypothetical protein